MEGPRHLPVMRPRRASEPARSASRATVKPKGWVRREVRMCPWAKWETAVVQPQVGQG